MKIWIDIMRDIEYLLGDFEVVAGYPVPRSFECRILPLQGRDPEGWVGTIQGTIEDVVAVDVSGPLLPVIRGRLDVQDRRVRSKSRTHWRRDAIDIRVSGDERRCVLFLNDDLGRASEARERLGLIHEAAMQAIMTQ